MLKIEVEDDVAATMNHPVLHPRRYRLVVVPPMKAVAPP